MKKRIVSLLLAAILLVGVMTAPVSAATAKDVYNCLKTILLDEGTYDSEQKCYYEFAQFEEDVFYGVFYWESNQNIEAAFFSDSFRVTFVLPATPKLPYTASVESNSNMGTVSIYASYTGSDFTQFASYSGSAGEKANLLALLNQWLPKLLDFTRYIIYQIGGYTLKDLGLTKFNICIYHCYAGTVTKEPTCVENGEIVYTCVNCGDTFTDTETLQPTGKHTWNSGTVVTAPTCTQDGVRRYTCTVCNTATKDEAIPALGHAWKLSARIIEPDPGAVHGGMGRYACSRCGKTKVGPLCAGEIFTDMPADGSWAHGPIDWAYFNGITDGITETTFGPNQTCTRAQVVTFLWRAAGEPEPTSTSNPFTDVKSTDWFFKPVLWAVEKGITDGMTATTFAPKQNCTRNQVVTFLWRAADEPEPTSTSSPFTDVKSTDWFFKPVLWAVEKGITDGVSNTQFGAKLSCTRAQVVTFLFRWASQTNTAQ